MVTDIDWNYNFGFYWDLSCYWSQEISFSLYFFRLSMWAITWKVYMFSMAEISQRNFHLSPPQCLCLVLVTSAIFVSRPWHFSLFMWVTFVKHVPSRSTTTKNHCCLPLFFNLLYQNLLVTLTSCIYDPYHGLFWNLNCWQDGDFNWAQISSLSNEICNFNFIIVYPVLN